MNVNEHKPNFLIRGQQGPTGVGADGIGAARALDRNPENVALRQGGSTTPRNTVSFSLSLSVALALSLYLSVSLDI